MEATDAEESMALELAARRLERDRRIAEQAGCPAVLRLEAYLPQCRRDVAVALRFSKPDRSR
jgi:hypothetical protein